METSQVRTLKPSQKPFEFPPYRRRPLRSKTFSTLVQILSHCDGQSHALESILEEPKSDGTDSASTEATGGNKVSENLSAVNELLVIRNGEITGTQTEEHNGSLHMEVDELGDTDSMKMNDDDRLMDNQEDQITLPEFVMEELEPLDKVMIVRSSKSSDHEAKESQHDEINESEVQCKEKELEKLISSSDIPLVIEDGEITDLMDFLLEEDPKSEGKSAENGQISHVITEKNIPSVDELQKRTEKDVAFTQLADDMKHRKPLTYDFVESDNTARKRSFEDKADKRTKKPRPSPQTEAKKGNNKDIADKRTKKPRRSPQTKAKKQNNKCKERSRAEQNKKQGVKRLRLDPIPPKPKPKPECRHFKMGRCHVENCMFSHNVIPATKSTACCHHARGSCLKGDECPYDHDLSKYACSNFITNGFCNRGPSCMFKHDHEIQMPMKEGGPIASNMPNPEQKSIPSSSLPSNVFPKKQLNGQDPFIRNPNIKSTSTGVSPYKTPHQALQTPISKPSLPLPKGMTFLSNSHISRSTDPTTDNASEPEVPKKTPAPVPRGINFLSFGKGIGKSHVSDCVEGKTPPVLPIQGIKSPAEDCFANNKQANSTSKEDKLSDNKQSTSTSSSFSEKVQLLSGTPSSVHKALQSTFDFAAKMDKSVGSSQNQATNKVSTILDFLYGDRNKNKQSSKEIG